MKRFYLDMPVTYFKSKILEISVASILQRKLRGWTFLSGESFRSLPDFCISFGPADSIRHDRQNDSSLKYDG